jgi:ligand-binding SRPBCC domain-containing protein
MDSSRAPGSIKIFEHRSVMATTVERMMAFHTEPKAFARLTPPPPLMFVQVLRDDRTSLTSGELVFRLWFGFIPVRWVALHEPGPTPTSFADTMIDGPMAVWEHQHIFREVPNGVELIDHIALAHKSGFTGLLTRLVFDGPPLRLLFVYRHWRTRRSVQS